MDVVDRLIELISQIRHMGGLESRLAYHLIANGVIVPPCRVGDTVWYELYGKIESAVVYSCVGVFKKQGVEITDANAKSSDGLEVAFTGKCIGKTIFITKEDAEAALKEKEAKRDAVD